MSNYEIESDIACPCVSNQRGSKYPFDDMHVGDSFALPDKTIKQGQQIATVGGKRFNAKFRAREVEGLVRIWRVE